MRLVLFRNNVSLKILQRLRLTLLSSISLTVMKRFHLSCAIFPSQHFQNQALENVAKEKIAQEGWNR